MAKILVAYASKYGSVQEIAEKVAATLRDGGFEADVRPASEVRGLAGYSGVVLGAALYYFRMRREAHRMLSGNRKELDTLPVAVFGSGPLEDTPEQFEGARGHLDRALGKHPWLTPISVRVFGGSFDPAHLRFPDNNPAMRNVPAGDLRDWDDIAEWAGGLADLFTASA